jgi:hypothetical protein
MEHAKSLLVFYMAITLFIFPANLAAGSKDYSKVFHDLRNYSQYLVNTSMSPKFNVDFRLHNTTGLISLVGYVNVNKLTAHKFKPFVFIGSSASFLTKDYTGYKAAKNTSETLKPATRIFQIYPPSSSDDWIHNKNRSNHHLISQTESSPLMVQFEGLGQNCCVPPDVQLAAGPNYVMEMVNLDGAIYTKSGSSVKEFGLEQLFNPKTAGLSSTSDSMTDPVLLFDSQSNRWFASISDTTVHSIRVAVSQTADPTGIWRVYNFPFGSQSHNCSDQPFMGVSEDKIVITVNNWANDCKWYSDNLPPEFRGVQFTVANKSNLIAGSNFVEFMQSDSNLNYFSLHPVEMPSPASTLLITTVGDFNHNNLQVLSIDGPLSNLHISLISTAIQTNHVPPDGIQASATLYVPGTTQQTKEAHVGTGDSRVQSSVWYRGTLWLAFNDACYVRSDTESRSCIRFIQLDTSTSNIRQDFDVVALGSSLYYPALSVDKSGNLGIIFGYSSYSRNPSLLISKHLSTDSPDSIEQPHILKLGTAKELSDRYGDYFAASPDPADGSSIWIAGEYHALPTWSTYIAQLHISNRTSIQH